jgi:hypothetical protein
MVHGVERDQNLIYDFLQFGLLRLINSEQRQFLVLPFGQKLIALLSIG